MNLKQLLGSRIKYFFFNHELWLMAFRHPAAALQFATYTVRHPVLLLQTRDVEGLISPAVGSLLYESVLRTECESPNVVEVGAYKGLSTIYLAKAARLRSKRVKSFELFSGLPEWDSKLDKDFRLHEYDSNIKEYMNNLRYFSIEDVVDLLIGDARETMLPEIINDGFSIAFLDTDVYLVTKELLLQLWSIAKGGEKIIVHDAWSGGIRKALDEFHIESHYMVKEQAFEMGRTAILKIPKQVI